eukprot:2556884-Pyramimonas_sp.AAC.1
MPNSPWSMGSCSGTLVARSWHFKNMPTTSGGQLPLTANLAAPTGEPHLSRNTPSTSQPG